MVNNKITSIKNKCLSCDADEYTIIYSGPIRSGSFGRETDKPFDVVKCSKCGLTKLKDFPKVDYDSSSYRDDYNDTADIENYIELHDSEQSPRIERIGIEKFRNKTVLDYGCGGGAFLDLIKGVAIHTIAIEPFDGYHKSLQERGHEVFKYAKDAKKYEGKVDIVTTFGVIEHVKNPLAMLTDIYELLSENGTSYIETDNLNDVLMHFDIPEFNRFFYRTAHYWYFDDSSLKNLCQKAGFNNIKSGFRHGYDLSNTFKWLKDRRPTGVDQLDFIDSVLNEVWCASLEKYGLAELLYFEVKK